MSAIDLRPLLSVPEVATILHVSRQTAYRLIREGEIPSLKVGGSVRVRPEDLAVLLGQTIRVEEDTP